MKIVSVIFVILCVLSVRRKEKITSNNLYLEGYSFENTNALKGLLALSIVLCHMTSRVDYELPLFSFTVMGSIGVGLFFFLSGYGLIVSVEKNLGYMNGFLMRRFTKILIPYFLMMASYLVYSIVFEGTISNVIGSFIGGNPVSNSWYVFAYLFCCFLFWLAFRKGDSRDGRGKKLLMIACGLCLYIVFTGIVMQWPDWWYKTILCFLMGVIWGLNQNKIEIFFRKRYLGVLLFTVIFAIVSYLFPSIMRRLFHLSGNYIWLINDGLMAISFTLLIGLLLYKINVRNKITVFLGNISYEIYLFHGLIMDVIVNAGGAQKPHIHQEIDGIAVLLITISIALLFHRVGKMLMKRNALKV